MKLRKTFMMLILSLLCIPVGTKAITKSDMKIMELEKILTIEKPEGYQFFQGMTITEDEIIVAAVKADDSLTTLLVYDLDSLTLKASKTKSLSLGHANDMFYSKTENKIYILGKKKLHILNAETLEEKESILLPENFTSVAYDEENKMLYFRYNKLTYVYDENFNEMLKFSMEYSLGEQAMSFFEDNVIYNMVAITENTENIEIGSGAIYIYSKEGNFKNAFYINASYGELESTEFNEDKGVPLLLFNTHDGKGAIYRPIYSSKENQITVKTDEEEKESKATLLDGNGQIETVSIKDGKYEFSPILYTEPGVYKYTIKKENNLLRSTEDTINVEVVVTYDAKINELTSKANYEKEGFVTKTEPVKNEVEKVFCEEIDNVFYDKDGNVTTEENFMTSCGTVRNPQTGSSISYLVWIIGLIGIIGFVIYKKRKFFRI